MTVGRIIRTGDDVTEGLDWLAGVEPRFARAIEAVDEVPLRRRGDGFEPLLFAIVSQQVSVASATAIWGKLEAAGVRDGPSVLAAGEAGLRDLGLSRQKIRYAIALAKADLDYGALHHLRDEEVIAALTAVPGIGRWTAEVYALFSLGRADVFAAGDLAMQEAARVLFDLDARPREKAFREMAARWSPWRGVAARLLWAYYQTLKQREGIG